VVIVRRIVSGGGVEVGLGIGGVGVWVIIFWGVFVRVWIVCST